MNGDAYIDKDDDGRLDAANVTLFTGQQKCTEGGRAGLGCAFYNITRANRTVTLNLDYFWTDADHSEDAPYADLPAQGTSPAGFDYPVDGVMLEAGYEGIFGPSTYTPTGEEDPQYYLTNDFRDEDGEPDDDPSGSFDLALYKEDSSFPGDGRCVVCYNRSTQQLVLDEAHADVPASDRNRGVIDLDTPPVENSIQEDIDYDGDTERNRTDTLLLVTLGRSTEFTRTGTTRIDRRGRETGIYGPGTRAMPDAQPLRFDVLHIKSRESQNLDNDDSPLRYEVGQLCPERPHALVGVTTSNPTNPRADCQDFDGDGRPNRNETERNETRPFREITLNLTTTPSGAVGEAPQRVSIDWGCDVDGTDAEKVVLDLGDPDNDGNPARVVRDDGDDCPEGVQTNTATYLTRWDEPRQVTVELKVVPSRGDVVSTTRSFSLSGHDVPLNLALTGVDGSSGARSGEAGSTASYEYRCGPPETGAVVENATLSPGDVDDDGEVPDDFNSTSGDLDCDGAFHTLTVPGYQNDESESRNVSFALNASISHPGGRYDDSDDDDGGRPWIVGRRTVSTPDLLTIQGNEVEDGTLRAICSGGTGCPSGSGAPIPDVDRHPGTISNPRNNTYNVTWEFLPAASEEGQQPAQVCLQVNQTGCAPMHEGPHGNWTITDPGHLDGEVLRATAKVLDTGGRNGTAAWLNETIPADRYVDDPLTTLNVSHERTTESRSNEGEEIRVLAELRDRGPGNRTKFYLDHWPNSSVAFVYEPAGSSGPPSKVLMGRKSACHDDVPRSEDVVLRQGGVPVYCPSPKANQDNSTVNGEWWSVNVSLETDTHYRFWIRAGGRNLTDVRHLNTSLPPVEPGEAARDGRDRLDEVCSGPESDEGCPQRSASQPSPVPEMGSAVGRHANASVAAFCQYGDDSGTDTISRCRCRPDPRGPVEIYSPVLLRAVCSEGARPGQACAEANLETASGWVNPGAQRRTVFEGARRPCGTTGTSPFAHCGGGISGQQGRPRASEADTAARSLVDLLENSTLSRIAPGAFQAASGSCGFDANDFTDAHDVDEDGRRDEANCQSDTLEKGVTGFWMDPDEGDYESDVNRDRWDGDQGLTIHFEPGDREPNVLRIGDVPPTPAQEVLVLERDTLGNTGNTGSPKVVCVVAEGTPRTYDVHATDARFDPTKARPCGPVRYSTNVRISLSGAGFEAGEVRPAARAASFMIWVDEDRNGRRTGSSGPADASQTGAEDILGLEVRPDDDGTGAHITLNSHSNLTTLALDRNGGNVSSRAETETADTGTSRGTLDLRGYEPYESSVEANISDGTVTRTRSLYEASPASLLAANVTGIRNTYYNGSTQDADRDGWPDEWVIKYPNFVDCLEAHLLLGCQPSQARTVPGMDQGEEAYSDAVDETLFPGVGDGISSAGQLVGSTLHDASQYSLGIFLGNETVCLAREAGPPEGGTCAGLGEVPEADPGVTLGDDSDGDAFHEDRNISVTEEQNVTLGIDDRDSPLGSAVEGDDSDPDEPVPRTYNESLVVPLPGYSDEDQDGIPGEVSVGSNSRGRTVRCDSRPPDARGCAETPPPSDEGPPATESRDVPEENDSDPTLRWINISTSEAPAPVEIPIPRPRVGGDSDGDGFPDTLFVGNGTRGVSAGASVDRSPRSPDANISEPRPTEGESELFSEVTVPADTGGEDEPLQECGSKPPSERGTPVVLCHSPRRGEDAREVEAFSEDVPLGVRVEIDHDTPVIGGPYQSATGSISSNTPYEWQGYEAGGPHVLVRLR